MMFEGRDPRIVCASPALGDAEDSASDSREEGHNAQIFKRRISAAGISIEIYVVVEYDKAGKIP